MTKRFLHIAVLFLVGLLCLPAPVSADQVRYARKKGQGVFVE